MVRRHQRVASRLSNKPGTAAPTSDDGPDKPIRWQARKTSQLTTQAKIAGNGQDGRSTMKPPRRSATGVVTELVDQAVEFVQGTELDHDLAEFLHPPAAFDTFLDPHLDVGCQQVGEFFFEPAHIA